MPGEGEKVIRKIYVRGTGNAEIKIGNGKRQKILNVEMLGGETEIPVKIKGKNFVLEIKLFEGSKIYRMEFETEGLKRRVMKNDD